ncbi:MAG: phenylacetate--CoA ligase family protein [Minisyncoccia bacterium]
MNNYKHFVYPKDINQRLKELKTKKAEFWLDLGKNQFDKLIKFILDSTPAYRQFLKDNGINPQKIKGFEDLKNLPLMNKNIYLKKYNYLDLFPFRNISSKTVSATSGSTGEPFYFPRGENLDEQYKYVSEIFLKNQWEVDKLNTLEIICFGLGLWIGGIYTNKVVDELRKDGYKITVAPVGTNKFFVLKTFKNLAKFYDQIILVGYPPFIKDLADEFDLDGVNFKNYKIRILNAAEGFSEKFREYIAKKFNLTNKLNDNINIYGSVELGGMANETAFSNLIRSIVVEKDKIFKNIFKEANRIPTLAQYHPYIVWFEEKDGSILASGYGDSIPLLRYAFPDRGGVITFDEMVKKLKDSGIDIFEKAKKYGFSNKILKLPFVYVYERSDFAVSLVGINLYPEYIKIALFNKDLQKKLTGKFSMEVIYTSNYSQKLHIHIELKKNQKPSLKLKEKTKKEIIKSLLKNSTEYNHLYLGASEKYKKQLEPEILFHFYEDEKYFRPGIKQRWSIK